MFPLNQQAQWLALLVNCKVNGEIATEKEEEREEKEEEIYFVFFSCLCCKKKRERIKKENNFCTHQSSFIPTFETKRKMQLKEQKSRLCCPYTSLTSLQRGLHFALGLLWLLFRNNMGSLWWLNSHLSIPLVVNEEAAVLRFQTCCMQKRMWGDSPPEKGFSHLL